MTVQNNVAFIVTPVRKWMELMGTRGKCKGE